MYYIYKESMMEINSKYHDDVLSILPAKLRERLMPFQREGINFALNKHGRCLIADEMGLGKTIQAIAIAYYYKTEWPLLIIVPSSLKFCWIEELEKWLPDILPNQINLIHCGSDASGIANSLITIVSYGLLRHPSSKVIKEAVEAQKFQIIICDESHYLKNIKTLSSKTIIPLVKAAKRRILLSGTPALSKPVELYPQIDAICPGKFGTFWQFTDRYCDARTVFFGKFRKRQFDGASNLEELQQQLSSMLMIRREKSQVLTELPPKQRQRVLFELKESVLKTEILESFSELRKKIRRGDKEVMKILQTENLPSTDGETHESENRMEKKDVNVFSQISKLYKLSGDAKIGPVREYIEMLCDNEDLKFLVFAYHHDMMNGVQQTLWEKKVKFVRIDGTTKSLDRQAYVTQFQSDPQTRVAILSILAAGVGLTFTSAKLVVFAELYWTPGVMVQCEDRAHRIGQTSSLPVHYLVARGTMDEWVWSAVCKKTIVTSTALTGHSKKLEHEEGDKYQIDLLSNAELWQPKEYNTDVDVANLIHKQRPADQSSILQFFTTQKIPELKPGRKRKVISGPISDYLQPHEHKQEVMPSSEGQVQNSNRNEHKMLAPKKVKFTEIVISSDDESEFQTPFIKRKTTNLFNEKIFKLKTSGDMIAQNQKMTKEKEVKGMEESDEETGNKIEEISLLKNEAPQSLLKRNEFRTLADLEDSTCVKPDAVDMKEIKDTQRQGKVECVEQGSKVHGNPGFSTTGGEKLKKHPECSDGGNVVSESCTNVGQWSCSMCTFHNHSEMPLCEMCDTPKGKMSRNTTHRKFQHVSDTPNKDKPTESNLSHQCNFNLPQENNLSTCDEPAKSKQDLCFDGEMQKLKNPTKTKRKLEMNGLSQCNVPTILDQDEVERCESLDLFDNDNPPLDDNTQGKNNLSSDIEEVMSCESDLEDLTSMSPYRKSPVVDGCSPADSLEQEKSPKETNLENINRLDESCDINKPDMELDTTKELPASELINTDKGTESAQASSYLTPEPAVTEDIVSLTRTMKDHGQGGTPSCAQEDMNVYKVFQFICSAYTGRIYLHDQDGKPLGVNFHPIDLEVGNFSELPDLLHIQQHQKLLQKFLREWSSLSDTKKRLIAKRGLMFVSPLLAFDEVKSVKGSKQRHLTKEDNLTSALERARSVQGFVRVISKHAKVPTKLSQEPTDCGAYKGVVQIITEAGVPLCLQCQKPYTNPLLSAKTLHNPENAWQLRLCSYACMDKYWTLTKAGYCRDQIYDIEHGVCRLCHYDTHAIFTQIKIVKDFAARAKLINASPYDALTAKQKQKMVENPQAGQFWHLDHITPVWQGGGLCDLDNMRTLCTPCHLKVTRKQAGERSKVKKLSGASRSSDITAFFQRH